MTTFLRIRISYSIFQRPNEIVSQTDKQKELEMMSNIDDGKSLTQGVLQINKQTSTKQKKLHQNHQYTQRMTRRIRRNL